MVTASTKLSGSKGSRMGRKLEARSVPNPHPRGSVRWAFLNGFRRATKTMAPSEIATALGVSEDMARKYLRGDRMPDADDWHNIAKTLGLKGWQDLLGIS